MNNGGQLDISPAWIRMLVIIFAVAGVGAGLMLKQVVRSRVPEAAPGSVIQAGRTAPAAELVAGAETGPLQLQVVEAFPPPDPFVATPAAKPARQTAPTPRPVSAPAGTTPERAPAAAAVPSEAVRSATVPLPEDLTVTGIVAGESPLVVVQTGGRTLFLKIGDQVADSWQLDSIGERSVVFRADKQQVTLPIQGGGSE